MLLRRIERRRGGDEMLGSQGVAGPGRAAFLQRPQHADRAAGIDLRARLGPGQQGRQVVAPPFIAGMHVQALAMQLRQLGQQGHAVAAAAAVMQLVIHAERPRPARHCADRRDADAAGDEDRPRCRFVHPEVIARAADIDRVAWAQMGVDPGRAAAPLRLAQYRDLEGRGIGRVATQGILACQSRRAALDIDMRTRRPARQRRAIERGETQLDDTFGKRGHAVHPYRARDGVARRLANTDRHPHVEQGPVRAFRVTRRIPFHAQVLRAAKRSIRHIGKRLLAQRHVRQAAREFLQEDLHLHARQVLAHALMRSVAEGQVFAGVVAPDVEQVGVREMPLVVVGRRGDDQQLGAGRDVDALDGHIPGGQAPPGGHRAVVPQALVDRVRDQARIVANLAPGAWMLQQQLEGVGGRIGGGFVRRDDAGHHHRVQVGVGHHVRVFGLLADAIFHPAGTGRVEAHLVEHLAGKLPELAYRVRHRHLLVRPGAAPGVDGMGDRILAQGIHVFFGHAEKMQCDRERHFPQHLVDQIRLAVVDEAVDIFARELAHHRFMLRKFPGRERLHQHAAARHVGRLVLVDQGAAHAIAVGGQHRVRLVAGRGDFLQRDRRTEGDIVAKDGLDAVVAGDHPVAHGRIVEHRFLLARPAHVVGRVLLVTVRKRVEVRGPGADRAAGGGLRGSAAAMAERADRCIGGGGSVVQD